jgi:iron complex outermembrane receptor protein
LKPSPLASALGVRPAGRDYEVGLDAEPFFATTARVAYLTVGFHPPWFDVKNIAAYQTVHTFAQFDFDGSERPIVSFRTTDPLFGEDFTEELQILSNKATPFADWLEWITGFYYIQSRAGFEKLDITVFGQPQPKVRLFGKLTTKAPAGFFQGTLRPLDWMDVTFGGRYQTEERRIIGSRSELLLSDGSTLPFFTFAERTRHDSNFSPKAVLSVRPLDWLALDFVDDLMTYVSWSKGFKSGTFNILNVNQPGDEVKAETVTTIELGAKSDFFDRRLRLNGAIFRNSIDDLQSQFISLQSGGTTNFENAGKATIEGAEIDLTASILKDLIFNVGATYLDGVYDEFKNASGFDPQTGLLVTNIDNSGNTIVRTPTVTLNSGLVYSVDLWRGVLEAAGDVYYNDGYFFDTQNIAEQPAYYLANVRAGYLYQPWNLRITGFGQNVNGAKRFLYKFVQDFGIVGKLAPPATYGVRIDWEF